MKKRLFNIFMILALFTVSLNVINANVEVFSKYNTYITVNKNYTFDVHKEIFLRNIHDVGIVPGQVEFKILGTKNSKNGKLTSYKVTNRYGDEIKSQTRETDTGSIILLDIFTPVLPGFEYKIDLKYTIEYESSGIFFKNIQLPLMEKTKIPIQTGIVEVTLPENYHITYIDYEDDKTILEDRKVTWEISKNVPELTSLEYSYIPIKVGWTKGSLVFWLTINLILIMILLVEIFNEVKKIKSQHGKKKK